MSSNENNIVNIGDEVLKFANKQGHRKARKDLIDWSRMKSHGGTAQFKTTKLKFTSTPYEASGNILRAADLLHATRLNQALNTKSIITSKGNFSAKPDAYLDNDCIVNRSDVDQMCNVSFRSLLKSFAEANIKLTTSLFCYQENLPQDTNTLSRNSLNKRKSTAKMVAGQSLASISLSPKFCVKLGVQTLTKRKIPLQLTTNRETIITLPPQAKCQLDIIEHKEEEVGYFNTDYYLWGSVGVTVWGKRYTLMITDVLDPKYNKLFERDCIKLKSISDPIQVSKLRLHGEYESLKIFYEVKQRKTSTGLYKPLYAIGDRNCICHDQEIPSILKPEHVLPLNNRNLALLLLRLGNYLHQFSKLSISYGEEKTQQIWKNLLKCNSNLNLKAKIVESTKTYQNLKSIDKFAVVLLLWVSKSANLTEDIKQNLADQKQCTVNLIRILETTGIATKTMCFLWTKEPEDQKTRHHCPVHPKQTSICLENFSKKIQLKLLASLPDRVLIRLQQRWLPDHGWISPALYLGIDLTNINSLLSNNKTIKTNEEKLLTILKLWRMKHRQRSERDLKTERNPTPCTIWDICVELQAMEVPPHVYNFLWKDSETTP